MIAGCEDLAVVEHEPAVGVGQSLDLGATFSSRKHLAPGWCTVGLANRDDAATVVAIEDKSIADQRRGVAAQAEDRNSLFVDPALAAIGRIKAEQSAVLGADRDDAIGYRRGADDFGTQLCLPAIAAVRG